MSFMHDSSGIDPDQEFPLLPEGQWFPFRIYEAEELTSKKSGNPMILAKCEVVGDDRYADMNVWHYVVFIPKGKPGEGINVHFRKCIGVPFGGEDEVDAEDWIGKRFMGKIAHEVYNNKKNHKIDQVSPMRDDSVSPQVASAIAAQAPITKASRRATTTSDDEVPF
jgi:hypothetical protein